VSATFEPRVDWRGVIGRKPLDFLGNPLAEQRGLTKLQLEHGGISARYRIVGKNGTSPSEQKSETDES